MLGFYFLAKFGLFLTYILTVYHKKSSSILLRKNMFNLYLHFSFKKPVPSQFLQDFSVENLETTLITFLSNFFPEIYLSRIINYRGSVFTLYLKWGGLSLDCGLSTFSFFFFLSVFSLTGTNDSQDSKGIIIFLVFHFFSLAIIHLAHRDFYHFFFIELFVFTRVILVDACSP